jgi:hypothetical protein
MVHAASGATEIQDTLSRHKGIQAIRCHLCRHQRTHSSPLEPQRLEEQAASPALERVEKQAPQLHETRQAHQPADHYQESTFPLTLDCWRGFLAGWRGFLNGWNGRGFCQIACTESKFPSA